MPFVFGWQLSGSEAASFTSKPVAMWADWWRAGDPLWGFPGCCAVVVPPVERQQIKRVIELQEDISNEHISASTKKLVY